MLSLPFLTIAEFFHIAVVFLYVQVMVNLVTAAYTLLAFNPGKIKNKKHIPLDHCHFLLNKLLSLLNLSNIKYKENDGFSCWSFSHWTLVWVSAWLKHLSLFTRYLYFAFVSSITMEHSVPPAMFPTYKKKLEFFREENFSIKRKILIVTQSNGHIFKGFQIP